MGSCFGKVVRSKDTELAEVPVGYGKKHSVLVHQQRHWAVTGVVSVRDGQIKELPTGLYELAAVVKVIDVSGNMLDRLPASLTAMHKLERMIAPGNQISAVHCQMSTWIKLKVLDLSGNRLSEFPDDLSNCGNLEVLKLSGNQLSEIPATVEYLGKLKELHVARNCLQSLPAQLGHCAALEHVDCSSNQLTCVPDTLGNLKKLRRLVLNDNGQLTMIPSSVLRDCVLLHTLEMHATMVSRQVLQDLDGYDRFEKRRQSKFSKAIDGNAMIKEGGVDEGIDVDIV